MSELSLLSALASAFGRDRFDATDVVIKARVDQNLASALDAAVSNCRYKSGWRRGRFCTARIRNHFKRMPRHQLYSHVQVPGDYWTFKVIDAVSGLG